MIKAIRGTKDILPGESIIWQEIESACRDSLKLCGYQEIRTPIIEETSLFIKNIGEETDIVSKEMFSFVDRGQRNISLRPEGTASIIRSYIENNLNKASQFRKLYYIGPFFRAERPQAGRLRQFHQIGVEAIGSLHPALDAEVIALSARLLNAAGINGYKIKLNNLGCREDKIRLSKMLKESFSDKSGEHLCEDCKKRIKMNPLRVLDCKNERCRESVRATFKDAKFICDECKAHFGEVLRFVDMINIKYEIDPYIVRGLDYYTRTVFEITHEGLGSKDAIGAGGRYDNLSFDMGGPDVGACGFALGIDRMTIVLNRNAPDKKIDLFIATIGEGAYAKAFGLLNDLRNSGISCEIDYEKKSLKAQMRGADSIGAKFVLIIGDDEMIKGEAVLRDMKTKEQRNIKFEDIVTEIASSCTTRFTRVQGSQ
ncbi:MAG: histidine--tRNA ligase [Candidatus Omnitrophota bacterium]|nr:histidine--tRNA ligase [Candidatus Omnitrophota bacterium]